MWTDKTAGNNEILFKRSTDGGTTFSDTPINLSNSPGDSGRPQIAVSGSNVYVVWEDRTTKDIYFTTSTDNGISFGNILNLSNDPHSSFSPQVARFWK